MNKKKRTMVGGVNKLPTEMEEMRMEVVDLELKARYWKAQFEIREYTLKAEAIQSQYNEYMEAQKKSNEEMLKRFQEEMQKKIDDEPVITGDPSEQTVTDEEGPLPAAQEL